MDSLTAALALHVTEEAGARGGFADWARRNAWPGYRDRDFVAVNASGLALTALGGAAARRSPRLFGLWYSGIVCQQLLWNPVFHLGATIAYREYSPGLVTALGLFPALWWRETRRALSSRRLSRRGVAIAAAAGGLIHLAAVRTQVYGRAVGPSGYMKAMSSSVGGGSAGTPTISQS